MIKIRKADSSDITSLSHLATETFYDAWRQFNSEEDMQLFAQQHFTAEVLKKEIADSACFFLLAYFQNQLAGYCKVKENNSKPELKNFNCAELEKLYVKKEFQNNKIGEKLLMHACEDAKNKFQLIWLSVWKPNTGAIKFYERTGFQIFGEQQFMLGNDVQFDFIMKKNIQVV